MITVGVKDGDFLCDDPSGAAWRIVALVEGLAIQATVHPRSLSRKQLMDWVRLSTARELSIDPDELA